VYNRRMKKTKIDRRNTYRRKNNSDVKELLCDDDDYIETFGGGVKILIKTRKGC